MKKLFIVILMGLVGIGLVFVNLDVKAAETRTIAMQVGLANGAPTLIKGSGGTLYKVNGRATSSSAYYVVYDASSLVNAGSTGSSGTTAATNAVSNILIEGGEATQYDSLAQVDFGNDGISFSNGLVIVTTTADVVVHYR